MGAVAVRLGVLRSDVVLSARLGVLRSDVVLRATQTIVVSTATAKQQDTRLIFAPRLPSMVAVPCTHQLQRSPPRKFGHHGAPN